MDASYEELSNQAPSFAEAYRAGFDAGRRCRVGSTVSATFLASEVLERTFSVGVLDGMRQRQRDRATCR